MKVAFATAPGSPEKPNEDAVSATAHTVAVVDGVTAPSGLDTGCIHGTPWYAANLASRIVSVVTERPGIHLRDALARALSELAASHEDTCDLSSDGTPSGTVAVLRQADQSLDYLVLSDASVVIETTSSAITVADKRVEELVIGLADAAKTAPEIGRASCRERVLELV